jgi:hypothetical protein
MLDKICADTLSDGPSDLLGEGDNNDNVHNKNYTEFEFEITRKIKKTSCHLFSVSESGSAKKQDNNDKREIYAASRECDMARTNHYSRLETFLEEIQG